MIYTVFLSAAVVLPVVFIASSVPDTARLIEQFAFILVTDMAAAILFVPKLTHFGSANRTVVTAAPPQAEPTGGRSPLPPQPGFYTGGDREIGPGVAGPAPAVSVVTNMTNTLYPHHHDHNNTPPPPLDPTTLPGAIALGRVTVVPAPPLSAIAAWPGHYAVAPPPAAPQLAVSSIIGDRDRDQTMTRVSLHHDDDGGNSKLPGPINSNY